MNAYLINDLFWTLQGEGFNSGRRALFVRLPFCDLKCPWCDTEFNSYKKFDEAEVVKVINEESARFAVITGGEPMMNKGLGQLIDLLKAHGFEIACETNGRWPVPPSIDFVTVSPKRTDGYVVHPHAFAEADEFKYVVDEDFDWNILKRHDVNDGRRYSLSPEFGRFEQSVVEIIEYLKEHPAWRLSLQTHKWIKVK